MRRRLLLLSALLASSTAIACSVMGDEAGSQESDHTEGEPTYGKYTWLWADETTEEFKENANNGGGWDVPEYVEQDHPMSQRLQFWVDTMDAALRKAHPEALKNTPKPLVLIKKDSQPNAWVSFIPVAWDIPVRLESDKDASAPPLAVDAGDADGGEAGADAAPPPPPEKPEANELLLTRTGTVTSRSDLKPFNRTFDKEKLGELLKYSNDGYAKCRLAVEDNRIQMNAACEGKSVRETRSKRFAYYATGKHVTFTTGYIFELLDEDRIVSTLAHELGHFYRSHANMPSDVTNYFYSLEGGNHGTKPPPDPRFLEQTMKAREKLRNSSGWGADYEEENKFMAEKNLGFYTIEQEADEIALEIVSLIGIPPGAAIDKVLVAQKAGEAAWGGEDTGIIKWKECAQLRDRGFKDENGKWVTVPVGDLSDSHHSWCFRAFNMQREIEAHKYKLGDRPTPPGEEFSKLLARLQNDVDPPTPIAKPDAGDAGAPPPADAGKD